MKKAVLGFLIGVGFGLAILAIGGRRLLPISPFVLGGVSSLVFLVIALSRRGRTYPHFTRVVFAMFGVVTLGWGLLGLSLYFFGNHFQAETGRLLKCVERLLAVMGSGTLLLLFVSGKMFRVRNQEQPSKETTSWRR